MEIIRCVVLSPQSLVILAAEETHLSQRAASQPVCQSGQADRAHTGTEHQTHRMLHSRKWPHRTAAITNFAVRLVKRVCLSVQLSFYSPLISPVVPSFISWYPTFQKIVLVSLKVRSSTTAEVTSQSSPSVTSLVKVRIQKQS